MSAASDRVISTPMAEDPLARARAVARRIEAGPPPQPPGPSAFDTTSNAALYLRVSLPPGVEPPVAEAMEDVEAPIPETVA
jgi:hypothetical protein